MDIPGIDKDSLPAESAMVPAKEGMVFEMGCGTGKYNEPLECRRVHYSKPLSPKTVNALRSFLKKNPKLAYLYRSAQIFSVCPDQSAAIMIKQNRLYWINTNGSTRFLTTVRNVRGLQWLQLEKNHVNTTNEVILHEGFRIFPNRKDTFSKRFQHQAISTVFFTCSTHHPKKLVSEAGDFTRPYRY